MPAHAQAVSNAMAALNSIIASSTTVESIEKAIVVAETTLSSNIANLVSGAMTPAQFQAATSVAQLSQDLQQAQVRGGRRPSQYGGSVEHSLVQA